MSQSMCSFEDCQRAIAPADGKFCGMHSEKLSSPAAVKATLHKLHQPKSAQVAANGIHTSSDFVNFMGALMGDLVEGKIDPDTADAAVRAGDSLLKVVEMRLKYGFKNEAVELDAQPNGIATPAQLKLSEKPTKGT